MGLRTESGLPDREPTPPVDRKTPLIAMLTLAFMGPTEWMVVLAVVLLLFGGRKLPQLARSMGSSITQFKKGLNEPDPDEVGELDESKGDGGSSDRGSS